MKKIHILVVTLAAVLCFCACNSEDYLKIDYYDILPGDIMFQDKESIEAGLVGLYDTFYPDFSWSTGQMLISWGWKPQYMVANLPTLDVQASGWDKSYVTEDWNAGSSEFAQLWAGYYMAISRCNIFLAGAEETDGTLFNGGDTGKKQTLAQARAIRAINYISLVRGWGRVPMLMTGENYSVSPDKPRPENDDESWALIIEDLTYAADNLDWKPINGQYGRITKGTALAYRAQAYMNLKQFDKAKADLKAIIDSGNYALVPCYSYLFDTDKSWQKEDIWAIAEYSDFGKNMSSSWYRCTEEHYIFAISNTASMQFGGWGSCFVSWECYDSFEEGDRRRDYSMLPVGGTNPWTHQRIGYETVNGEEKVNPEYIHVKCGAEFMPNISSLKYWRMSAMAQDHVTQAPFTIHCMRYANVLLDYAECCFETGDEASGWAAIKEVRNRAFGNLEPSLNDPTYPIPLQKTTVTVPDAKTVYTAYKAKKGYQAPVWKVAVSQERRKEFNLEQTLFFDLKRSGMMEEHINCEYPKGAGVPNDHPDALDTKNTWRIFDYDPNKMTFPIPTTEMQTNKALGPEDQNPGY